jgi:hypothetical protein
MDINGGQLTQTNGNPALPATTFTGPLTAGNVIHGDGTTNLAGVGGQTGQANGGYAVMAQTSVIKQATNGTVAGVWTDTNLIIPAQSQILRITLMVTTAWTGSSTTLGIGNTVSATAYTTAGAGSAAARGQIVFSPGTVPAAIGNWDNVGTSDVQIVVTSTNTGSGVGTLTVEYIQGINNAS